MPSRFIFLFFIFCFTLLQAQDNWDSWIKEKEQDLYSVDMAKKIATIDFLTERFFSVAERSHCEKIVSLLINSLNDHDLKTKALDSLKRITRSGLLNFIKEHLAKVENTKSISEIMENDYDSFIDNTPSEKINISLKGIPRTYYPRKKVDIVVRNLTNETLHNVKVAFYLPFSISYTSCTPQVELNKETRSLNWKISQLTPDQEVVFAVSLQDTKVFFDFSTRLVAHVFYDDSCIASISRKTWLNCFTCSTGLYSGVPIQSDKEIVVAGEDVIYSVKFGGSYIPMGDIRFEYTISENLQFVDASPKNFTFKDNKIIFASVPVMEVSTYIEYEIKCRAIKLGNAENVAEIRTDYCDYHYITMKGYATTLIY